MAVGIEEVLLPEEQLSGRAFTDEDRELLRSYGGLIEGLADLFGKHCEVVLHSLENLHESVIQIANGFNTGRTLGRRSPIWLCACSRTSRARARITPRVILPAAGPVP